MCTIPTPTLRKSIGAAADVARLWFESRTTPKSQQEFEAKGKLGDSGDGSVYAYFDADGKGLYVGLTKRRVKARLHDQTSPHKDKPWWSEWKTM